MDVPPWLRISTKATAEEVKAAAGFGLFEWDRFKTITREEARRLIQEYPELSWAQVAVGEKRKVIEQVNSALAKEEIRECREDVINWRMSIAVRDLKQSAARTLARKTAIGLADPATTGAAAATGSLEPPRTTARPFDPIRDL